MTEETTKTLNSRITRKTTKQKNVRIGYFDDFGTFNSSSMELKGYMASY